MRVRGLIVLLLLAGGLLFALFATQKRAALERIPSESVLGGRRLFDAKRIVLQRSPDLPPLHFVRSDPTEPFMLAEPIVDLASAAFLENVRGVLDSAQRFFDGPVAEIPQKRLAEMGLDVPRGHIEVRYPDKTFALDIGLEGPLHQDLYVKMDGNVYRTGLAVWSAIQVNPDEARERLLLRTHPDDMRRFTLRRRLDAGDGTAKKDEVVELLRVGAQSFRLSQPIETEADTAAAVALLSFLSGMVAEQFLGGLNPMPEWDVQVEVEGGHGVELITIWKTAQGLIGRQQPRNLEFTIKSVNYERTFEVAVDELRQRWLVPMSMLDIVRLEMDPGQGNGERIQLRRGASDALRMLLPIEVDTEPAPINELLQATQKLQIVGYVPGSPTDLSPFGLDREFLTVSLHPRMQEHQATVLHFGRSEGDVTFVKRSDAPYVAKVPKEVVDVFRQPWSTYASRAAAIDAPTAVTEVRYSVQGQAMASMQRGTDGKWLRADTRADVTDQANELIEIATSLRGKRTFDAQAPTSASELAAARRVQIELVAASTGAAATLEVYDRGGEGTEAKQAWVVQKATPRLVIELGPSDSRALLAPLRR